MAAPENERQHGCRRSSILGSDRATLVITMLFLVSLLSIPKFSLLTVVVFAAFPLFLMQATNVTASVIARRLLQLSPFVLFMAAGNLFFDRQPMLDVAGFAISGGMVSALVIVMKTLIIIATIFVVTHSIPFYRICRTLETLHLPETVITQLILLDRYRTVVQEEALSMQRARDIRSFGGRGKELFRTASLIGSLLLRTTHRAERLYRSMSARGFQERMSVRSQQKISASEWRIILLWALLFVALRLIF